MSSQASKTIGALLGGYISLLALARFRIEGMSSEVFMQKHGGKMLGIFLALAFICILPHFIERVADIYSDLPGRRATRGQRIIASCFALFSSRLAGMVFAAISLASGFAAWVAFTAFMRGGWHPAYYGVAALAGAAGGHAMVGGLLNSAAAFGEMWRRLREKSREG
jgi:hypothetical protein